MRGAAATDGSVLVGRRPVQESLGYLTAGLVFPSNQHIGLGDAEAYHVRPSKSAKASLQ